MSNKHLNLSRHKAARTRQVIGYPFNNRNT